MASTLSPSDEAFETQHREQVDQERESVSSRRRYPRYPARPYRRLKVQARFADILAAGVIQGPVKTGGDK